MNSNNELLTQIGKELEDAVFENDAASVKYWADYRTDIMAQLVAGHVTVPPGMTADQVVDTHVGRVRQMCEQFGAGLPVKRNIIQPAGGSHGVLSRALQSKSVH